MLSAHCRREAERLEAEGFTPEVAAWNAAVSVGDQADIMEARETVLSAVHERIAREDFPGIFPEKA